MQKFTPCLSFEGNAEEAAGFYVGIFKDSEITAITHYGPSGAQASGMPEGSVMTVTFRLDGQEFLALNGGPASPFSPAMSFMVNCSTQEEVDELWERLSEGGATDQCGWLKDKFGVSWQIVPSVLGELLRDKDPEKMERTMKAMLQMTKLDVEALRKASL